ncbi:protein takeout [Halyomorpha halys]|uniref:protein takeout n=1 Tax=Halyomorpha halys TaxID=286706 RepID=UPI0006D51E14|nr:protein takeout [Halyomorpha halys]XP_014272567.1 protein takeout [Halyomorpha halys]
MALIQVLFLFAVLPAVLLQESFLPKTWTICHKSDPNINICMKTAITSAIKELMKGDTKLEVPPIDPMLFRSITVDQGAGPVGITLKFTNLNIHGLSRVVIDNVRTDYSTGYRYDIDFHVTGKLRISGDYVSNGKVLVIPIRGEGKSNMTFDNFSGRITMRGQEVSKDGERFIQIYKTDIIIETTRLYLSFRRPHQETISTILNRFMNDNWQQILNDMKPAISQSFGANIQQVANKVFSKIPARVIAPP